MYIKSLTILMLFNFCVTSTRLPLERFKIYHHSHKNINNHLLNGNFYRKKLQEHNAMKVLYQIGTSEDDLPECNTRSVCNKIDLYDTPWVERQCKCPSGKSCSKDFSIDDGYSFMENSRLFKLCDPIKKLPKCRYFRDTTWSITLYKNNITDQIIHCHCPKNSVTYLNKGNILRLPNNNNNNNNNNNDHQQLAYQYFFSCSPQTRLRCQRKEPCKLFTVHKRQEFMDEVNVNLLCQCPHGHKCPHHHTDHRVIPSKNFGEENFKTYSGYCLPP